MPTDQLPRPQPDAPLGFVGFTFHLFVAATCWYFGCLFLGMALDISDMLQDACAIMMFVVGPLATTAVCILLGRWLRRVQAARAGLITLACALVPVVAFPPLHAFLYSRLSHYELEGPDSPTGNHVLVSVRNCLGIGPDFYTDVRVIDGAGKALAEWHDRCGQRVRGGPERLRDSMRWLDAHKLEFTTNQGAARIELK